MEAKLDANGKIDPEVLRHNFNFDKFEILESQAVENLTLVDRFLDCDMHLNFKNKQHMVYLSGAFAAAASLLSNLDQSIISGASIGMNKDLHITEHQMSLISALMPLGAMAGSIIMKPHHRVGG